MSKQTEKLKKQLLELAEAINAFDSEAVQIKVITRIFTYLHHLSKQDHEFEMAAPGFLKYRQA